MLAVIFKTQPVPLLYLCARILSYDGFHANDYSTPACVSCPAAGRRLHRLFTGRTLRKRPQSRRQRAERSAARRALHAAEREREGALLQRAAPPVSIR